MKKSDEKTKKRVSDTAPIPIETSQTSVETATSAKNATTTAAESSFFGFFGRFGCSPNLNSLADDKSEKIVLPKTQPK